MWEFFRNRFGKWEILKRKILKWDRKTCEYAEIMWVRGNPEKEVKKIWRKRQRVLLGLLVAGAVLFVVCFWQEPEGEMLRGGRYLVRPQETSQVPLLISGETGGDEWEKEMILRVKNREFNEEEKEKLELVTKRFLEQNLKAKNASLEEISQAVSFAETVPDTGVALRWDFDMKYFRDSGKLIEKNILAPVNTEVRAKAVCGNWKHTYHFTLRLIPREYSPRELAVREVKEALKQALKEQSAEPEVLLPEQVGDTKLVYRMEEAGKNYLPVYLCLLVLFIQPLLWSRERRRKLTEREEQLLSDHPGVVNKIMLLLSAGLTVRLAVERLAGEYEEERKKGGKLRYAYEEICVMNQEMRDGISEGKAMERFGRRCRLLPYLRFASVITQNIKKGAEGIIEILEEESLEALEQRKERALRLGEKAGTKLLFPMILMLGLVMGIVMLPAFMTM